MTSITPRLNANSASGCSDAISAEGSRRARRDLGPQHVVGEEQREVQDHATTAAVMAVSGR
jgi:hypothetical protein